VLARHGWQVRRGRGDRLYAGLFVHGHRDHGGVGGGGMLMLQRHLVINQQHLAHLPFKVRIPPLQVLGDLVGPKRLRGENAMHRGV